MKEIIFGIVIPTYQRSDGSSPKYLSRAIDSVMNQTYQNFKVIVIGDKYEDNLEFERVLSNYPKDKIYYENLKTAKEREKYINNKWLLWSYGGVNATNYGIEKSLSFGHEYICHLDHDDFWFPNHLQLLNECISETNTLWLCTKSTYNNPPGYLPLINTNDKYVQFYPEFRNLIHSSICMNFKKIPLRYRDVYEETKNHSVQADGDLWNRVKKFLIENNLKSYMINQLTCIHEEEGHTKK
jgi:glycosyltransferase involved in cell wall biosynthesis